MDPDNEKEFCDRKISITGDRLISISAEQNMQWAIYCTAACGRNFCTTAGGSVTMSHIKDWWTREWYREQQVCVSVNSNQ
jgi:hypothetical protein